MNIVSVPHLKEIEKWESYFYETCNFVQRRKYEENWAGTNISRDAEAISFNFDM